MIVWVLGWFYMLRAKCYVMGVTGKRDWEEKGGDCEKEPTLIGVFVSVSSHATANVTFVSAQHT
ncbi:hypothetical protein ACB094_07G132000 [Castanea mollissima]